MWNQVFLCTIHVLFRNLSKVKVLTRHHFKALQKQLCFEEGQFCLEIPLTHYSLLQCPSHRRLAQEKFCASSGRKCCFSKLPCAKEIFLHVCDSFSAVAMKHPWPSKVSVPLLYGKVAALAEGLKPALRRPIWGSVLCQVHFAKLQYCTLFPCHIVWFILTSFLRFFPITKLQHEQVLQRPYITSEENDLRTSSLSREVLCSVTLWWWTRWRSGAQSSTLEIDDIIDLNFLKSNPFLKQREQLTIACYVLHGGWVELKLEIS